MEVTELRFKTTNKQVHMLEALANMAGVTIEQAARAAIYLGVTQALEKRAEDNDDLLNVHMIDKILAVEEAGAVDASKHRELTDLIRRHETIIENLKQA